MNQKQEAYIFDLLELKDIDSVRYQEIFTMLREGKVTFSNVSEIINELKSYNWKNSYHDRI